MEKTQILIIAEHSDGRLSPVAYDMITLARNIVKDGEPSITIAFIGKDLDALCTDMAEKTGLAVHYLETADTGHYNGELYKTCLSDLAKTLSPSFILTAHSSQGMDFAPCLAARLSAACITSVNGLSHDENGTPLFSRSICGGMFNAFMRSNAAVTMLTVQPGYFAQPEFQANECGTITRESVGFCPGTITVTGIEQHRESSSALKNARVIVAAGRGIGDESNLEAIKRFASHFPGAAVAGSRPLIDLGWMEYKYQVGITGTIVSPDVYIACGISGSSQHIAGMNTSGYVIAINSDPHAAIFNVSDLCIVDDLTGFIEVFEEVL